MKNKYGKNAKVSAHETLKTKHLQNNVFALYGFEPLKLKGLQDKYVTFFQERPNLWKTRTPKPPAELFG